MKDRYKLLILAALVVVFLAVNFRSFFGGSAPSAPASATASSARTGRPETRIPDADLRLQSLEPSERPTDSAAGRNIFEYGHRPAPEGTVAKVKVEDPGPPPPPPPPPPPVRFYGFAEGSASGARRVFLTDGEAVFVARQGDVILRRYRLTRIGNDSIDIEEISGANRWTVKMEQP